MEARDRDGLKTTYEVNIGERSRSGSRMEKGGLDLREIGTHSDTATPLTFQGHRKKAHDLLTAGRAGPRQH